MKRSVKYTLLSIVGILILTTVTIFGLVIWGFTHADIDQSNGPVSREMALQHCSLPFPQSAHNIQYATYAAGLQEGHIYVRFEAPVQDCYDTAKAIFTSYAKDNRGQHVPEFVSVSHPQREQSSDLKIDWFDNDHISKGMVAGSGGSWEPEIWIDEERGVFYYEAND